ncbi:MAG: 50S ribosomal protein L18 [Candidatus Doudnabacteria bacterium RIFCSPHIGHO2_01_FULL_49_9]|uniref:Large ribosomal subunit protein uL18 n=1 Tax=Candidatus Doudnabacteria bacterium RIFCSPHIGHO2_01_FULL_49_9 TaxID=1817827 RepID=A0A1F5NY72_9BACT|nr:ribosomal protein L18 [uncultured bacterium]OGE82585.1 MAG: 50S ribosomal protein L18 [Candidatus Doudnabacteria bacterium RIFCSPHIGHO2_01_FULL_49_9]
MKSTREKRITRHRRIRAKISGSKDRPRLTVFRSNRHLHLQLVDDSTGRTIASASTKKDTDLTKALADKAIKLGVKTIVFDRSGYLYHGRIAKIAEELRKAGLTF